MKKLMNIQTIVIALMIALAPLGFAADDSNKKDAPKMDHSAHKTDHSDHKMGNDFRQSAVDGFAFTYKLIDMTAKIKTMANKPEMKDTHHLMVYVKDAHGHPVKQAKVGFMIQGPDNAKQKKMCMAMGGGFGADINFKAKGVYTVMVKVVAGDKNLKDKFEHEVK